MSQVSDARSAPASAPPGLRIYAIGDVHGRLDLLLEMAKKIEADLGLGPAEALTIFLGDYVDRGPSSAQVVERLSGGDFPTPLKALRGNHEDALLKFLDDAAALDDWRQFGGLATLHSYGVDVAEVLRGKGFDRAQRSFRELLPERHRRFLASRPLSETYGDYFFCHAGVRPGLKLEEQSADDLLWIRDEFLDYSGSWEKVIVHGHTPVPAPDLRRNRINIDTGAYATSILTALVLEDRDRRFIFAAGSP